MNDCSKIFVGRNAANLNILTQNEKTKAWFPKLLVLNSDPVVKLPRDSEAKIIVEKRKPMQRMYVGVRES